MEQFRSNKDEWTPPVPACVNCGRPMQENKTVSTPALRQFLCSCQGQLFYVNLHRNQRGKGAE
jgi:hypothetical protein